MACDNNWRGVPLSEIYGSQSPWGAPEFPMVSPSFNHTVLYHIPSNGTLAGDRPPKPQNGHDKWDHDVVRMPCSSQSLYPVEDSSGETRLKKRWQIIEDALWKPIRNSHELANTILSYNTKFKKIWKFRSLHKLFNEYLEEEESQYFFDVTLPEMAKLALALPKLVTCPIPLLKQQMNKSLSLSQQQIASLLANAFFCTFPRRNTTKKNSEYASYPHINFNNLYECSPSDSILEKLKCICHYFRRVCTKAPVGVVTFCRRHAPAPAPGWARAARPVGRLPLHVEPQASIEDALGLIQLDFANKYLGGGVLGHGCVQEEIRFVICPELLISMLFTEVLKSNEALLMIGCERYSKYSGYGSSFQWAGEYVDCTPHDSSLRRRCAVLAIDALPYSSKGLEFTREAITRELNKAWVGFTFFSDDNSDGLQYPGVATGNWGCGAFGGTPQLKVLIQMMACAEARRPMAYYTFKDTELRDEIINVYNMLARFNVSVGQLYNYIVRFTLTDVRKMDLYAFLYQILRDEETTLQSSNCIEHMEINESPETSQTELPDCIQQAFLNESPDLFSPDEDNTKKVNEDVSNPSDSNNQIAESHTNLLFKEMQKFDDDNGKLNFSSSSVTPLQNYLNQSLSHADKFIPVDDSSSDKMAVEHKMAAEDKMTEYNMADETKIASSHSTLRIERSNVNRGNTNKSPSHISPRKKRVEVGGSNASVDNEDKVQADMTSEAKKKIARKITDYFSKK